MTQAPAAAIVAALATVVTAHAGHVRIVRRPTLRWQRRNHRGARVSLAAGPAVATGVLLGCAAAPSRAAGAAAVAVAVAAAAGCYDDAATGDDVERATKGWRGHVGALGQRRLSAGLVKAAATAAGAGAAADLLRGDHRGSRVVDAIVIAGTAHVANLLDLRPGRAGKAVIIAGGLVTATASVARRPAAAAVGAAVVAAAAAELPADLAERTMLGDLGAGALGAGVGAAAAAGLRPRARLLWAAGALALTVAAERVSFSSVIDRTPALRRLDALGRARS